MAGVETNAGGVRTVIWLPTVIWAGVSTAVPTAVARGVRTLLEHNGYVAGTTLHI